MNEILQSFLTEVKILREEVSVLKGQFEDKVAEEETFTNEKERIEAVGYIPKADAAAFLLISTRSICRYKHQFKLVTKQVVTPDIRKIRLTDFMKALGQEHPVAADGNLRIYKAPYDPNGEPTMVINIETNLWRDTKSGAYGGIYDLAYEMTGSANMRELNMYIAGEMSNIRKVSIRQEPKESPKDDDVARPKRKMRL